MTDLELIKPLRPLFLEAERRRKPVMRAKGLLIGILISTFLWTVAIYAVLYAAHLLRKP